jgi:hypothetical protein
MTGLFLAVVIVAIVLGIVGVAAQGMFYLLIVGIVLFLLDLVVYGVHLGRAHGRRPGR